MTLSPDTPRCARHIKPAATGDGMARVVLMPDTNKEPLPVLASPCRVIEARTSRCVAGKRPKIKATASILLYAKLRGIILFP